MATKITQASMERIFHWNWHDEIVVSGKSLELLIKISKAMERLAPNDNYGTRQFWFEINENGKRHWYLIASRILDDHIYVKITDHDKNVCTMSSHNRGNGHFEDMKWFLKPFLEFTMSQVNKIMMNPDYHKRYVEKNLPFRQRIGKIKRSDFNRIFPIYKVEPQDIRHAIDVLYILAERNECFYDEQVDCMRKNTDYQDNKIVLDHIDFSISCKYFRIADECFFHIKHNENINDVEYYTCRKNWPTNYQNIDKKDIISLKLYYDGEIGNTGMNLHVAYHKFPPIGFIFEFEIMNYIYVAEGIDVAIALYDAGVPFVLKDADKLLAILEERDEILLMSSVINNLMGIQKKINVFTLPYEENCGNDDEISREQYESIVKLAEWEPEVTG